MNTICIAFLGINLSEWISLISVAISIFSFFYSWKTRGKIDKQQIVINKYVISAYEDEKDNLKKADIQCIASIPGNRKDEFIMRIKNCGKAQANNIVFCIVDDEDKRIKMDMSQVASPYPSLLPNHYFDITYQRLIRCKNYYEILFTWDDEYEQGRQKQQSINP